MKAPFFDLSAEISNCKAELAEISAVIDSGKFVGGPLVEKFEMELALFNESKCCAGVGNGLDAIRIVLEALEIRPGAEVIVPSLTCHSTWLAVVKVGATPSLADVLEGTAGLNPELIEVTISLWTSAKIGAHLYGIASRVSAINRIADNFSIPVIEDCAQSHCASIEGKKVGTFGLAGAFPLIQPRTWMPSGMRVR
jgi:dTDP-4-amino-4,6-dideoxygalactose transaminase